MATRKRISSQIIGYGLHFFFLGLLFKNAPKALSFLLLKKISHVSIWKWLQKYRPWKFIKKNKIKAYIMDKTAIKAGSSKLIWLWLVIEPKNKEIFAADISKKRNISIAKRFLSHVVNKYGLHAVLSDGGGTLYPQACKFLKLKHHFYSHYGKSIIEKTMKYKR